MDWIKNVWLDIAVTIVLLLAVLGHMEWAWWAIAVYSPFMLLLKVLAFAGRHSKSKIKPVDAGVPPLVYHVLYAANVVIASYGRWWWIAGCWAAIWILSAASGTGGKQKA